MKFKFGDGQTEYWEMFLISLESIEAQKLLTLHLKPEGHHDFHNGKHAPINISNAIVLLNARSSLRRLSIMSVNVALRRIIVGEMFAIFLVVIA